jgi:tripartite-type tricarboxylate transporter receptor subunit TctC
MRERFKQPSRLAAAVLILLGIFIFADARVNAQTTFYDGKAIRMIVGFTPGGGYDAYTRTIGRHMGKHIPGNPAIIVENMPGAGSMISANYVFKAAKPDGLTIGHFIGGLFLQQLLAKPGIEFDAAKFHYVGVPAQDNFVIGIAKSTGIADVESWLASKQVVKFGGVASGSGSDDIPNVLKVTLGLPIQLVSGYKGTADVRLAFNSGEVAGLSNSWESTKSTWRKELETGELKLVLQVTLKPHPEFLKLPMALNYAKTDEAKRLISTVARVHGATVRPYVLPPNTPADRVQIIRKAFMDTMKDPDFLAEAKKANLDINPADGIELEQSVKEILKLEPGLVAKLKEILK